VQGNDLRAGEGQSNPSGRADQEIGAPREDEATRTNESHGQDARATTDS
jgi:hypothetical protein